jgi:hypothetical protein
VEDSLVPTEPKPFQLLPHLLGSRLIHAEMLAQHVSKHLSVNGH